MTASTNKVSAPGIITQPDTLKKLQILSADSRFDMACACSSKQDDRRIHSQDHMWIYPVTLPNGGTTRFLKTLVSNVCSNDCAYCPLREDMDPRRVVLQTEEVVRIFMDYYRRHMVWGLFLSSGVTGTPDATMQRMIDIVRVLRLREHFFGYIHLKIIPGASRSAIEEAVQLADAVSINLETTERHFKNLSHKKRYRQDIITPLQWISDIRKEKNARQKNPWKKVTQTTQFIVGAAQESDAELIQYMGGLYQRVGLNRIYFSAYQRGFGRQDLPGEKNPTSNADILMREHRLYQSDFLLRQYGFTPEEIPLDTSGNLSLQMDPKAFWATQHPEFFPLKINQASRQELLRVPGLGPTWVRKIMQARRQKNRISNLEQLGKVTRTIRQAQSFLVME